MAIANLTINLQEANCPGFFKFFIPNTHAKQLNLPSDFTRCLPNQLPNQVVLRDRHNNLWQVKVGIIEDDTYFQDGWVTFVEDNLVENGDLLVFDYICYGMFSVKLLNECGKKEGVERFVFKGIEWKEHTTRENEHEGDEGKYLEGDSEDNVEEEDEDGDEEVEEDNIEEVGAHVEGDDDKKEAVGGGYIKEEQEVDGEDDEEDIDEGDTKKVNEDDANRWEEEEDGEEEDQDEEDYKECGDEENGREKPCRKKRIVDIYGDELFRFGLAVRPKNSYFLTRITNRKSELYIPRDFIKHHSIDLAKVTYLIGSWDTDTEWKLKYRSWKGGRANYTGEWRKFCEKHVRKEDTCICELVKGKHGPYIIVSIVRGC